MRKKVTIISGLIILILFIITFSMLNKSYSYGLYVDIEGTKGSRVLKYYDSSLDVEISFDEAYKYYGVKNYDYEVKNGEKIYFYKGQEITENEYVKGHASEEADDRASLYGSSAYRVHTTSEFEKAFDDIYNNLKIGEFRIEFSPYEDINFTEVKNYYDTNYGLTNYKQNWYTYAQKGEFEPDRFGLEISGAKNEGELILETYTIRISGNERVIIENYVNKILPYLKGNGTDYEKIALTFNLLKKSEYLVDDGFINDNLSSYTSAYDALITRKTNCIGYSIAFSYIMDKLGIESYIVDNIATVDAVNRVYSSTHTWNIVKLDNVFYKVDVTGNILLKSVSSSEVTDFNNTLSSTNYANAYSVSIDNTSIDKILNEVKNIKTTTTKKVEATTTTKTYPYEKPTNKTTTKLTTKDADGNTYVIVTDKKGNTQTVISTDEDETATADIEKTTNETTQSPKTQKKFNFNYILIPFAIGLIIFLIIYKLIKSKKIHIKLKK